MGKITALKVANYFRTIVDLESGSFLTNLKLQKLVYYSQAWHLSFFNRPLFKGAFEAWAHGPVLPELYDYFKEYSWHEIPALECFDSSVFTKEQKEHLDEIWRAYGKYDGKYLEDLSHSEPPWKIARGDCQDGERCNSTISEDSMKSYYSSLLSDA